VVAVAMLSFAGCAARGGSVSAGPVLWQEGEDIVSGPKGVEMVAGERPPASGGKALYGANFDAKGNTVMYQIELGQDVPDAQATLRYCRLHWRPDMKPAPVRIELSGPGGATVAAEVSMDDTKGWGTKPSQWGIVAAKVGDLARGRWTVKLISQADGNDLNLDGFLIAPASLKLTREELNALGRIQITSQGYLGLRSSTTIRQDAEPALWVGARAFAGQVEGVQVSIRRAAGGQAVKLQPAGKAALEQYNLESLKFALPKLDDGDYVLSIESTHPACRLEAAVTLAGELLGSLGGRLTNLEKFAGTVEASGDARSKECLSDVRQIIEYLKANGEKLSDPTAADEDPFKAGLAYHEGSADAAPLVANMRRALDQAERMRANVEAGRDALAGLTGDLRRAFTAKASGLNTIYRMYVPTGYAKAAKLPLILFLHGGGGDEDYWPDMEGGRILQILQKRGYMAVMPKWHSRTNREHFVEDMMELIARTRREFPKVDPARVYVTGISMGGFGTYAMATTHPETFAAACCVSGTGNVDLVEKLKTVPLQMFQGGADTVVPPEGAKRVAARMKELGYTVDLHIFPTYGHGYHADEYLNLTLDFFDKYRKESAK
jgi:dienelactone hydrolase